MELLENLLEKKLFSEYSVFIEEIESLDKMTFFQEYIDFNEKFDGEDNFFWFNEKIKNYIYFQDLVKEIISHWLEIYGIVNFKWEKNNINNDDENNIKIFFRKINKELDSINYKVVFIDRRNIGYCYYFIISNENFAKIDFTNELFKEVKEFGDIKEYELYLLTKTMNLKLKGYLRNKFTLRLNEINDFVKKEKILIATGNKVEIEYDENEIKELGGEIKIIEKK